MVLRGKTVDNLILPRPLPLGSLLKLYRGTAKALTALPWVDVPFHLLPTLGGSFPGSEAYL